MHASGLLPLVASAGNFDNNCLPKELSNSMEFRELYNPPMLMKIVEFITFVILNRSRN